MKRTASNFNPRSREGSDHIDCRAEPGVAISIHAPVKGATDRHDTARHPSGNFNPRSREGSDEKDDAKGLTLDGFQSTLP